MKSIEKHMSALDLEKLKKEEFKLAGIVTATVVDSEGKESNFQSESIYGNYYNDERVYVRAAGSDRLLDIYFVIPREFIGDNPITDEGYIMFQVQSSPSAQWYAQYGTVNIENNIITDYRGKFNVRKRKEGDPDMSAALNGSFSVNFEAKMSSK
ncbi:hypothetical protein ABH905_001734 [Pseudomonas frederiksbergensis]|uniref:hypothetical protein n=1 Tax=Pseudomonas frederiksbergensis TaxID=104087 RepID=UPI003D24E9A8